MVDLPDAPALPRWDGRVADALLSETETMRRLLAELWSGLDKARWQATANWTGRSSANFDDRFAELERLAAELRGQLEAVAGRVAAGAGAADEQRRRWVLYQASPALGLANDLLDWLRD
jgi:uncharacterized protein YukE